MKTPVPVKTHNICDEKIAVIKMLNKLQKLFVMHLQNIEEKKLKCYEPFDNLQKCFKQLVKSKLFIRTSFHCGERRMALCVVRKLPEDKKHQLPHKYFYIYYIYLYFLYFLYLNIIRL